MNEILPGQLIQDAFNKGCLPIPKPETGPRVAYTSLGANKSIPYRRLCQRSPADRITLH